MVPDDIKKEAPYWERVLFNRLRSELSDEIIILHSLGIARHQQKRWGECDFVLVSPDGIFVIEVKGGSVYCREGKWVYVSPDGLSYTKHESPWEQAKNAMFSIKEEIEKEQPLFKDILYGFGVILPDELFLVKGPEIEQEYLLDRREWHKPLDKYFKRLVSAWKQRYIEQMNRTLGTIGRKQREEIRKILRPDSVSAYTLSSRLNNAERQLVDLTSAQIRAFQGMQDNLHVIVEGGAGTGKTLLAFEQARRYAMEGLDVLFLCYSRLLALHLRNNVKMLEGMAGKIFASSLHNYYMDAIAAAGYRDRLNELASCVDEDELYGTVFPHLFMEAVIKTLPHPYDVLIIDEAQDILSVENLEALDLVLDKGLRHGRWLIFLDRMQNIYNPDKIKSSLQKLENIGFARYKLSLNCRNTLKVAVVTSIISTIDMVLTGATLGGYQKSIYFSDGQFKNTIEKLLKKLHNEGISSDDIIFLSTRQFDKSSFSGLKTINGKRINDLSKGFNRKDGYDFCTMQAFKGLERKLVIATDVFDRKIPEKIRHLLIYAGLSRATTGLILIVHDKHKKEHEQAMKAFGARLASIKF
jgi:hypothetical protein